jgi:predicted amidohydrolase
MEAISNIVSTATSVPSQARKIIVAGAQLGPIHLDSLRSVVLARMLKLMEEAHAKNAKLIVYPEIAFTTFFPRHLITHPEELELFFERDINGDATQALTMKPIFDAARTYKMDVSVGYAECDTSAPTDKHIHYNSAVYYSAALDKIISKYRKVHLPGTFEPYDKPDATNQLEKRYFLPGDLGFEAFRAPGLIDGALTKSSGPGPNTESKLGRGDPIIGTLICNDRRWPEAWRCYGLQGAEIVLCGYNTTGWAPELVGTNPKLSTKEAAKAEALFHNKLTITHGSYVNACFSINVAKCGMEDGIYPLIGGSCIVDPDGKVVVEAKTEEDELIVAEIDLEMCRRGKGKVFAFERHRRTEHYKRLVEQTGVVEPELL